MSKPWRVRTYFHADTGLWTSNNTVTYFSINFINILSYYRCLRYLVLPALFPSISMVFNDYTCIKSVTEFCKYIRLLLKSFSVLYHGRLHYFSGPCYVCYPQFSLSILVNVSNKPCFVLICMLARVHVLLVSRFAYFIHLINALSFNRNVCYQMIHKLFWVSV